MSAAVPPTVAWAIALTDGSKTLDWSAADWDRRIRLARRLRLLARLAERVKTDGLLDRVPHAVRRHLVAESRASRWRTASMVWALERATVALGSDLRALVLLKGAAYIGQDLVIAQGRLPSDLDVLVPRDCLDEAQRRLFAAGWAEVELDEHDQRYYREWTHEVPPMRHPSLRMELDLHHNILPPLGHVHIDVEKLLAHLRPARFPGWQTLAPVDQVLHSAAHLFFDSELRDRLRDLVDLDGLIRTFRAEAGFWDRLTDRAIELGLQEPLALACHFTTRWLGTPFDPGAMRRIRAAGPGPVQRLWLLPLLGAVLTPADPDDEPGRWPGLAATLLLARYHWRRLPLRLLVPHLWRKWRLQRQGTAVTV